MQLKPGYTCRTTVIFGTLRDGSFQINNLASNNCFSYRNLFQNGVNALLKSSKFHVVWTIRFCSNSTSMWCKHFFKECMERPQTLMSALATVARKSFDGTFTTKIDFPIGHFMLPLLMLTSKIKDLSLHYLISI